ncbi:Atp-dependent rna helicase [Thalictrum thalictroides]|uniref:RNA helicase n=1 Tax=Thalictrum thalictroides TaxID=46969 RepID=A0A7J6W401_THATH|nr:Atp-dependent rna helicase [Thalictrum thalictroides]
MAAATVRYAPEDPTLPKPWKGLVDGNTGYLYFWNPVTNVTQYEKPTAPSDAPSPVPQKAVATVVGSPVRVEQPSQEKQSLDTSNGNGVGHDGGSKVAATDERKADGWSKVAATNERSAEQNIQNGDEHMNVASAKVTHSDIAKNDYDAQTLKSSAQAPVTNVEGPSAESYRRQHEITVIGDNVPPPFTSFESTGFPPEVLRVVRGAGFKAPTPIQAQSWPIAMRSHDIVAVAKTGSGKTLGYLLPGFMHIKRTGKNPKMGPTVLVLSPTRELATQIQDEAEKFGQSSKISCTCLYGGAPKGPQIRDLEQGVNIVVATPGRLNDIMEMGKISLKQVSYLVLDEADRMLDMGFEPQIRKILKEIPPRRQTLMYTATWPKAVRNIASEFLNKPVQVNIGRTDQLVANKSISQHVDVVSTTTEKNKKLEQIVKSQEPRSRIIIFCSTKRMCDQLVNYIPRQLGAAAIHGDKSQGERDSVLNQFRNGSSPILVATDVAARGLDVKDIRVVVNYDFPTGIEDYVHRIGRTGRGGASGLAYTFFCEKDAKHASDLIKILEGANQRVPPELRDLSGRGYGMSRDRSQWSSGGHGGQGEQNDSGYGGRGGRGRSEGGYGGRGFGRESNDSGGRYNGNNDRKRSRSPPKW